MREVASAEDEEIIGNLLSLTRQGDMTRQLQDKSPLIWSQGVGLLPLEPHELCTQCYNGDTDYQFHLAPLG